MKATSELLEPLKKAKIARDRAYAPYSNFKVGVVIIDSGGDSYLGCNVENSSYPLSLCAERSAVSSMLLSGYSKIKTVFIIGSSDSVCMPCGGCLQVLSEFGNPTIYCFNQEGTLYTQNTLRELLPNPFEKS